ncbi:hypothetical protein GCM10027344_12280 [Spelaeicoccus albus]
MSLLYRPLGLFSKLYGLQKFRRLTHAIVGRADLNTGDHRRGWPELGYQLTYGESEEPRETAPTVVPGMPGAARSTSVSADRPGKSGLSDS